MEVEAPGGGPPEHPNNTNNSIYIYIYIKTNNSSNNSISNVWKWRRPAEAHQSILEGEALCKKLGDKAS